MKLISKSSTKQRIIALAVLFAMVIGLVPFNSMSVSAAAFPTDQKLPTKYGVTLTDDGKIRPDDEAYFGLSDGSSKPTHPDNIFAGYAEDDRCYEPSGKSANEPTCSECDESFLPKISINKKWSYLNVTTNGTGTVQEGDTFNQSTAKKSNVYLFADNESDAHYLYIYVTSNLKFDVRWQSKSGYAHCTIYGPGIYKIATVAKKGFNDLWLGAPSLIHTHAMEYSVVKAVALQNEDGSYGEDKDVLEVADGAKVGDMVRFTVTVTATCNNCDLTLDGAKEAGLLNVYLQDTYIGNGRFKVINWTKDDGSAATFTGDYTYEHTITGSELKDGATSFTNTVTVYPDETGEVPITGEDGEPLKDEATVNITEPDPTKTVKVKVTKVVKGDKGAPDESFTIRLDGKPFTLKHNETETCKDEFKLGETYTFTEDDMSLKGFKLESVTIDPRNAATYDKDAGTIMFHNADKNNTVTIKVKNKYTAPVITKATITVTKKVDANSADTAPTGDKFTVELFGSDKKAAVDSGEFAAGGTVTFPINEPGTYYLREGNIPAYYSLSGYSGGDGELDTDSYYKLTIASGTTGEVAVTLTNAYEPPADGTLKVTKKVVDLDGVEIDGDSGSFVINLMNGTTVVATKTVKVGDPVTFEGLVYGRTYTVSEDKDAAVADGYSWVSTAYGSAGSDTEFVPNADDKNGVVTVTNRKDIGYDGQLTINKYAEEQVYDDDGEGGTHWEAIAGAPIELLLYRIADRDGKALTPHVQFREPIKLTTDDQGNGTAVVEGLPYGTYQLSEPDGEYYLEVDGGNEIIISGSSVVTVNATNKVPVDKYLGEITVKKTGDAIDGHKFTFRLVGSNLPDGIKVDRTSPAIGIGDSHTFEGLPPGTYTITENLPAGYDNAYVTPQIDPVTLSEGATVEVPIVNELNTFDLTVNKTLTGMPADFNPEDINFTVFDGETLSDAKITRTEKIVILNKEGTYEGSYTFMNLPMGKDYTVREYLNGTQYKPVYNEGDGDFDEGAKTFTKEVLWNNSAAGDCTVEFTNTLIKGEITVEKVDKGGNTITTSEATFQLLDGDVPLKTQSTIDGFATFSGLEIGKVYTLKEIDAPRGYALNEEGVEITLTDEYFEIVERFVNDTANGELTVEKTIEDADGTFKDPARIVNINDMVIQVVVKNEGNAPLYNLKVVDAVTDGDTTTWADYSVSEDLIDGLEVEPDTFDGKLAVGETVTFTYTTTPPEVGDTHADTVTVTGTFETVDGEDTVVEEDSAEAESVDEPVALLSITKSVNGTSTTTSDAPLSVTAGSTLTFTFTVRNTGNVDLTDIVVTDTTFGVLTDDEFDGSLAAGAEYTFTRTLDAPTAGQTHTNVVTAIGFYEDDEGVTRQTEEVTDDAYARTPVTPIIDDIRIRDSSGTYSDITSGGTTETTSGETPSETVEPNYVPTGTPDVYQLMDEDDTPLGYFTPVLREDGDPDNPDDYDWVEVEEDGTPLGIVDIPKDNPKTNDNSFNKIRYIALIASACLALACVVITRKRRATSTNR